MCKFRDWCALHLLRFCIVKQACLSLSSRPIAPSYLVDVFHRVNGVDSRRRLRSASTAALFVRTTRLSTVGDRAFHVAAARTCNSLPPDVTLSPSPPTFKRHLETVVFARSYSGSFACAWQYFLAVTRVSFVFLCGVLVIFWLCATIIRSFMMMILLLICVL